MPTNPASSPRRSPRFTPQKEAPQIGPSLEPISEVEELNLESAPAAQTENAPVQSTVDPSYEKEEGELDQAKEIEAEAQSEDNEKNGNDEQESSANEGDLENEESSANDLSSENDEQVEEIDLTKQTVAAVQSDAENAVLSVKPIAGDEAADLAKKHENDQEVQAQIERDAENDAEQEQQEEDQIAEKEKEKQSLAANSPIKLEQQPNPKPKFNLMDWLKSCFRQKPKNGPAPEIIKSQVDYSQLSLHDLIKLEDRSELIHRLDACETLNQRFDLLNEIKGIHTPLTLAVDLGLNYLIEPLLDSIEDHKHLSKILNGKNATGHTALHQAALRGNADAVGILGAYDPELNIGDNEGWTALGIAGRSPLIMSLKGLSATAIRVGDHENYKEADKDKERSNVVSIRNR